MMYIFETRYVKKYGVGRGGGADQKKKIIIIIIMLGFLVMHPKYCDRMAKTLIRLDLQVFFKVNTIFRANIIAESFKHHS